MRRVQLGLVRSLKECLSSRFQQPHLFRAFSINALPQADGSDDDFNKNFDQVGKGRDSFGADWSGGDRSTGPDGLDESLESLKDGTDKKLEQRASFFDELFAGEDTSFVDGASNKTEGGPLVVDKYSRRFRTREFEVTTEEVLRKADFRNIRFLTNFLSEGGTIIKRKQTKVSAKAQRRIAREIKTSRSFGLLPTTTQGTKPFNVGTTMEDRKEDYVQDNIGGWNNFPGSETDNS